MVDRPISIAEAKTGLKSQVAQRVYCEQKADVYTADGTRLYLEWIIEGRDGVLYRVQAEPGGWLRRRPCEECPDGLELVPAHKAMTITWLTYADTDDADDVSARAHMGYFLEHQTF